jgi:hypothetical protein
MSSLPSLLLLAMCVVPPFLCTWLGLVFGKRVHPDHRPENQHIGTVQGALLGLLALLLGFAFSGAMSRFVDRQDALSSEANAIESAYARAVLLPTKDRLQTELREYARLRLRVFQESVDASNDALERELNACFERAFAACVEGVKETPALASLMITSIDEVNDQFTRRTALARRHLPGQFVFVMLVCTCVSLGAIGYGAGLVEKSSVGIVFALTLLTSTALYVTFDFDRPQRGLIRLDETPLINLVEKLSSK